MKPRGTIYFLVVVSCFLLCINAFAGINDGLIAYYPLNGDAKDASGNGKDGTVSGGPTWTTDRFGNQNSACSFDGVNDYISIPFPGLLSQGTISACVKYNSKPATSQTSIWFSMGNTTNYDYVLFGSAASTSGNISLGLWAPPNTNALWANSGVSPQLNGYRLYTGVWGPTGMKIYIDGDLKGTNSYAGGIKEVGATLAYLGKNTGIFIPILLWTMFAFITVRFLTQKYKHFIKLKRLSSLRALCLGLLELFLH